MMRGRLTRDKRIVAMNPILIQEVQGTGQNNQHDEENNKQSLHSVNTRVHATARNQATLVSKQR
jgi:hypothetical protein